MTEDLNYVSFYKTDVKTLSYTYRVYIKSFSGAMIQNTYKNRVASITPR